MATRRGWTRQDGDNWTRGEWKVTRGGRRKTGSSWYLSGPDTARLFVGRTLPEALHRAGQHITEHAGAAVSALRAASDAAPAAAAGTPDGWLCPGHPFGHEWAASLTCQGCGVERPASEAIVSGLAGARGWSVDAAAAVRDAHGLEAAAAVRLETWREAAEVLRRAGYPLPALFLERHLDAKKKRQAD